MVLQESVDESLSTVWMTFKALLTAIKDLVVSIGRGMRLPEISRTLLNIISKLPLINRFIPDHKTEEQRVQETVDTITAGDAVAGVISFLQQTTGTIWRIMPLPLKFKNEVLLPMFNYNDRLSFFQSLYRIMIDNDIPPKYAKAYLTVVCAKFPIYQIMFVFKTFGSRKEASPTPDDLAHPFTAGSPKTNPETGLNEAERAIHRKIQLFIQANKIEYGDLERKRKLAWEIVKESIMAVVTPMLAHAFDFFKLAFGVSDTNILHTVFDPLIKGLLLLYYYYFLITALILASLAISNEETFHPSKEKIERNALDQL